MRANAVEREPLRMAHWRIKNIYQKMQEKNAKNESFILHDGPPFTNGDVHVGTALIKLLKDVITRYKNSCGFATPYIPGWDCHGLPIEHKVSKAVAKRKKENLMSFFCARLVRSSRKVLLRHRRSPVSKIGSACRLGTGIQNYGW